MSIMDYAIDGREEYEYRREREKVLKELREALEGAIRTCDRLAEVENSGGGIPGDALDIKDVLADVLNGEVALMERRFTE